MEIRGIITAMVTPFYENQQINYDATKELVGQLIKKKVDGLFILGTNGEFHVLSSDEKISFAKVVIDEVAGRIPVYVGTGGNSTDEVIKLSKVMGEIGADALSVITPYFVALTENELITHYMKIADEAPVPVILYNIPKNTGIKITKEVLAILAKHPNIIGIKDSSGDINNLKEYIEVTGNSDFSVLVGSDSLILKALELGATGAVAATSNVLTKIDVSIYKNWLDGNLTDAQNSQDSIEEFRHLLKLGTLPSVLKAAIECEGIKVGPPRAPTSPVNQAVLLEINRVMKAYHALHGEM